MALSHNCYSRHTCYRLMQASSQHGEYQHHISGRPHKSIPTLLDALRCLTSLQGPAPHPPTTSHCTSCTQPPCSPAGALAASAAPGGWPAWRWPCLCRPAPAAGPGPSRQAPGRTAAGHALPPALGSWDAGQPLLPPLCPPAPSAPVCSTPCSCATGTGSVTQHTLPGHAGVPG